MTVQSERTATGAASPVHAALRRRPSFAALAVLCGVLLLGGLVDALPASAAQAPVGLGAAAPFAVLAGSTVTNTGSSVISGDLGLSPGKAVTGFPPGLIIKGTEHVSDRVAQQAQAALTTAYNDAAGRTPVVKAPPDLGNHTLTPGVYHADKSMSLTGTLTLDAEGDPSAVFVFQAGSTLITASNSTVKLIRGAQPCNVFWQVGSSGTLGTGTNFVGTILALTSNTLDTGANVEGRVLARNGAVTLDDNTITEPTCAVTTTTTTPAGTTTTTATGGSSTTTIVAGATTTTVAGGGATTTTVAGATTTTATPTTVPGTHTGEPWAGWTYWALVALLGLGGLVVTERAVRIRRRQE